MNIFNYIRRYIDPSFTDGDMPFSIEVVEFPKNHIITAFGQREGHAYFLCEGITQIALERGSSERILDFFFPGSFFCSYSSLLKRAPSDVEVSTLTPCKVEAIRGQDLFQAYEHSLLANKIGRIATEYNYMRRVEREKDFLGKTAEERYQHILSKHSELINQLPVYKVAAYLGIHPESLSRIRKQMAS